MTYYIHVFKTTYLVCLEGIFKISSQHMKGCKFYYKIFLPVTAGIQGPGVEIQSLIIINVVPWLSGAGG